jgi:sterol desaturase/sphingolipid hydroxylase (fatty acid hydroxylase superfamily)
LILLLLSKDLPMDKIINFFNTLGNGQKLLWIFVCLTSFLLLENVVPLVKNKYNKWQHSKPNLVFLGTTILINVVFGIATAGIFLWQAAEGFGVFYMIKLPVLMALILSVMLLDLIAQYVVHFLLHRVKFMWKFHMVHHSDTMVDATTGTRHHPGDYVLRELFSLLTILIFGMPFAYYMLYRILTILFTYFSHANISLPNFAERWIGIVFITPNMHKFHHHFERPWTDSNFGNIFSFWDRLFGTLVLDDPKKIKYGLDVLDEAQSNNLSYQLKLPFDSSIKTDY